MAHKILLSALGPNPSFFGGLLFNLGVCWDRGLDLDQGLTIVLEKHIWFRHFTFIQSVNSRNACLDKTSLLALIILNLIETSSDLVKCFIKTNIPRKPGYKKIMQQLSENILLKR